MAWQLVTLESPRRAWSETVRSNRQVVRISPNRIGLVIRHELRNDRFLQPTQVSHAMFHEVIAKLGKAVPQGRRHFTDPRRVETEVTGEMPITTLFGVAV